MSNQNENQTKLESPYCDQDAAAAFVCLSPRTLEKLRCTGTGPAFFKIGKRCLYRVEDLVAWVESNRMTSTSSEKQK
jgi:hypothetical protein